MNSSRFFLLEQNLDRPGVSYCAKITHDDNAITNAIDIYDNCRYVLSGKSHWDGLSICVLCLNYYQFSDFEDQFSRCGCLLWWVVSVSFELFGVLCSGAVRLMSSNNDSVVRVFDCNNFSVLNRFYFPWAVNVSFLVRFRPILFLRVPLSSSLFFSRSGCI